jgi:hypothetical protein
MSIKLNVPAALHTPILMLCDLVPGTLYSVITPSAVQGDIVMAVRGDSGRTTPKHIVVLECRRPFNSRTPFLSKTPLIEQWSFGPPPEGTTVTIKND